MPLSIALVRALHFASGMLLLALAAAPWLLAASPTENRICRRWTDPIRWAWAVHLASGAAWDWLVFSEMAGVSPWELDGNLLATGGTGTSFGRLSLLRAGIAGGLALVLWTERRRAFPRPWRTVPLAAALLGSLAWAGHAAAGGSRFFALADGVHLLAAGIWPASLLPLALFLASASDVAAIGAVRRFSAISLVTVALLAATGSINAWHLVGGWSALATTGYGQLLVGKVALFAAMVAIGARNLLALKPRLPEPSARISLRRNVLIELALGTAVVVIVAVLGMLPPPAP